ncbi:hypothetical protein [Pseudoroseicyclus tamaricis]|uniref:Uncharacterized protein n=1 Tax=Pseudoroseicyclus tamaricis TaxID=2705421 RepID=A0A6B2K3W0_9RHOB|nr:hypothetical protein [Pseudoroseicyclus tamaricis]NDV02502.1 hypothetical protein [Pseudoroseicyclus tamaricis]
MKKPNVSADAIGSSALEQPGPSGPVGPDPMTRDPVLDQKMGAVGRCLGYGDEKKANIAGLAVAVFTIVLIAVVCVYLLSESDENRSLLGSLITPVFGVITGSIGYITGRKD